MLAAALITFREGLEAALIVGIVLGYLRKVGLSEKQRSLWWGVIAAVAVSLAAALGLLALGASLEGRAEELFEGITMLLAAGVLTWMIFWMQSQGKQMRGRLEADVELALAGRSSWALFLLAFLAVVREGIETALFLGATVLASSPGQTLLGGFLGLVLAVVAGWAIFAASTRLNISSFFRVTSILLLVVAAGLVAHGVHELQEAGVLPVFVEHLWDLNPVLDEASIFGSILKTMFGYNGNPSLLEVVAYVVYGLGVGLLMWRGTRPTERTGGSQAPPLVDHGGPQPTALER